VSPMDGTKPLLYSRKDAVRLLGGISIRTLDSLIAMKELPARRIGGRVFIHYADLERFARRDHQTKEVVQNVESGR
jgi:hypothetical protein